MKTYKPIVARLLFGLGWMGVNEGNFFFYGFQIIMEGKGNGVEFSNRIALQQRHFFDLFIGLSGGEKIFINS